MGQPLSDLAGGLGGSRHFLEPCHITDEPHLESMRPLGVNVDIVQPADSLDELGRI